MTTPQPATMHRYEFRADWFTVEDATDRRHPHEMAGTVEAATIRDAIAAVEAIASPGEAVAVRSVWMIVPQPARRFEPSTAELARRIAEAGR